MGLKHWILPKDHFKTHLFFSIFWWGDASQLGSWSEGYVKPLKLSREAIRQVSEDPYHTEFFFEPFPFSICPMAGKNAIVTICVSIVYYM